MYVYIQYYIAPSPPHAVVHFYHVLYKVGLLSLLLRDFQHLPTDRVCGSRLHLYSTRESAGIPF